MKKNTQVILSLSFLSALLISGCASSSKSFQPKDLKDGEAVMLGNIKINIDGEDLTKHCYVGFNGNNKPYISLDETGNIIAGTKTGKNELTYISCMDMGFITVVHNCNWKGAEFVNVGNGKQTYFGNIIINWEPSGKGGKKALALLGGLGAGMAAGIGSCGKHEVIISSNKSGMEQIYKELDPAATSIKESLITSPK